MRHCLGMHEMHRVEDRDRAKLRLYYHNKESVWSPYLSQIGSYLI